MKRYRIVWLDGSTSTVEANSEQEALVKLYVSLFLPPVQNATNLVP